MAGRHGPRFGWLGLAVVLVLTAWAASARADDPIDLDVAPRYGRYTSTLSFLQGGEADRLGLEAEKAPIPGAEDAAVEIDPEPDAQGNAKWVHFRLEVDEVQEEVYPGEFVTFWVYAPLGKAMGAPPRAPSPTLRVQEGDRVIVTLYNTHYLPHTIHFHGMDQSADMDGVPDMPHAWVKPGESFTYEFIAKNPGTYFYHCHVNEEVHVPMGLGGMFIVEPRRPRNHFARLIPGAGRIPVLAKGTAEQYQSEYSLVYLDIDSRLNRIPALSKDPRETERRMFREYDSTQRVADIFLLNGRSFPFTLRDTPIVVKPDEHTRLRILDMGGNAVYFHTHGHHPTLTDTDGRAVPPGGQLVRDTFDIGPSQRIDLSLDTGSNSPNAAGPGHWMVHNHTPPAATNRGIGPGGSHTAIVYQTMADNGGPPGDADVQHLLHMHARYFDPAYYQGKLPVYGTDIFHTPAKDYDVRGAQSADKAARPYPVRAPRPEPVPRLDLIDAERHRPVASACDRKATSFRHIVIKAGTEYARAGEAYGFEPRQIRLEKCQEVEVVLENHDSIRHDLMIPGLNPMFTLNFVGPGSQTARFITPGEDVTLPFHCHVPVHDKVGMLGEFVIGKGSGSGLKVLTATAAKSAPAAAVQQAQTRIFEGVGTVLAVLPRQGRVVIKHDAIKGYMAAMEMSFALASPDLANGIAEGDRIAFKLNDATATLQEIRVLDRPR